MNLIPNMGLNENEKNKSDAFKANTDLNDILMELISLLKPVQLTKQKRFQENKYPIAFIVGNPRSGTTILLQWLASLGIYSFPTNVLNRFAYAPYIGALIQQMLYNPDFEFKQELDDLKSNNSFVSDLGKTKGALSVHEFQHLFRNFTPNFDPEFLNENQIKQVDFQGIKSSLASIEAVFDKPFVVKATMLQFNLKALYNSINNSIYIFIKRNPVFNMQSLLFAREKYYSNRNMWWSVKPKEYELLKDMDIYHQIAGQVFYTNQAIEKGLENIPDAKKLTINYEEFCETPQRYYQLIIDKYKQNDYPITQKYNGVKSFNNTNELKLSKEEIYKLEAAYQYFVKNNN